jgi:type IV secretory pathway VirB10-like protein
MTESQSSPKVDPESLVLRAAPRRVVRFKRNLLVGAAAVGLVAVAGTMGLALAGHGRSRANTQELYNTEHKNTADGLATLPSNYGQVAQAKAPQLGAPLPGDLGPPILRQERALGIASEGRDFQANAEADGARAERMRIAQQRRRLTRPVFSFRCRIRMYLGHKLPPPPCKRRAVRVSARRAPD